MHSDDFEQARRFVIAGGIMARMCSESSRPIVALNAGQFSDALAECCDIMLEMCDDSPEQYVELTQLIEGNE